MGPFDFLRDNGLKVLDRLTNMEGLSDYVPTFSASDLCRLLDRWAARRDGDPSGVSRVLIQGCMDDLRAVIE